MYIYNYKTVHCIHGTVSSKIVLVGLYLIYSICYINQYTLYETFYGKMGLVDLYVYSIKIKSIYLPKY